MPQQATTSIRFAPSDGESTPGAGHLCFPDGVITANLECLLTGGSNRSGGGHGISGTATTVTVRFTDPDGREADLSAQPCEGQCSDWPQADMVFGIPVCPAGDPCERLEFYGPTVIGHPGFCLSDARYTESDCLYQGPDGDPWHVYTEGGETNPIDHTLRIGWPLGNLWSAWNWPSPNYAFNPPLAGEEAESPPVIDMIVPSVNVRLPMRLFISKVGTPLEYEVSELIDTDAPALSGGDGYVASPEDVVWELTDTQIADAIGETPDESAIYELYWRIYKGEGDIIYQLTCNPSVVLGDESTSDEYIDRRGTPNPDGEFESGGHGIFDTCNLTVARVKLGPAPLPFYFGLKNRNFSETEDRRDESLSGSERVFETTDKDGSPLYLSWSGASVMAGGKTIYTAPGTISALHCRVVAQPHFDASGNPTETTTSVYELTMLCGREVYRQRLITGFDPELIATTPDLGHDTFDVYFFNADGTKIGAFRIRQEMLSYSSYGDRIGFAGWRETESDGPWTMTYPQPLTDQPADGDYNYTSTREPLGSNVCGEFSATLIEEDEHYHVFAEFVVGARFAADDSFVVQFARFAASALRERYYLRMNNPIIDDHCEGVDFSAVFTSHFEATETITILENETVIDDIDLYQEVINEQVEWSLFEFPSVTDYTHTVSGTVKARPFGFVKPPGLTSYTRPELLSYWHGESFDTIYRHGLSDALTDTEYRLFWTDYDDTPNRLLFFRDRRPVSSLDVGYGKYFGNALEPPQTAAYAMNTPDWPGGGTNNGYGLPYYRHVRERTSNNPDRLTLKVNGESFTLQLNDKHKHWQPSAFNWAEFFGGLQRTTTTEYPFHPDYEYLDDNQILYRRHIEAAILEYLSPRIIHEWTDLPYSQRPSEIAIQKAGDDYAIIYGDNLLTVAALEPYPPADALKLQVNNAVIRRFDNTEHVSDITAISPHRCLWLDASRLQPNPGSEPPGSVSPPSASELIAAHNDYRIARGLPELSTSSALTAAAEAHIIWMVENDHLSHAGADGSSPEDRALTAGWTGDVAENLALGAATIDDVMRAWGASPPHAANLTSVGVTHIGAAIGERATGETGFWWCVLFGGASA